jgi:LuxR family transcriptional regulator, maltose regulon positive regulatory protein
MSRLALAARADASPLADSRPPAVVRERLIRLLSHADASMALVVAPAGSGKTTLLRQWAARDARPVAVLDIRDADNEPGHLLESIARTLAGIAPAGERSLAGGWPVGLALDGVERLVASESLAAVADVAGRLPAGSLVAVASRREPALAVGRLRTAGELVEVRAKDLAMTRREAAAMLRGAGLALGTEAVASLVRRTEGWPAGLALAATLARSDPDPARAVQRFSGASRVVADYFRDEVLAGLDVRQLRFLADSAILEVLTGPACDAVLRRRGSGTVLRDLARANVPLICLDQSDTEYRHHVLFAEMLRAELSRAEPERERELRQRASAWYGAEGDLDLAVRHAVAAGDAGAAGSLLWANAAAHLLRGRTTIVRSWLDAFKAGEVRAEPGLALTAAAAHLVRGERDHVEHWAAAAERGLHSAASADGLAAGVALMRAGVCRDGLARMADDAARAYALAPDDSPWRSPACLLAGVAAHLTGDRMRARGRLQEGARRGAVAAPAVQVLCLAQLALMAIDEGDWDEAEALSEHARAQIGRVGLADAPLCALALAVSARVRAQRGRADVAQADRGAALRMLRRLDGFAPWYSAELRIVLAGTAHRLGDAGAARALVDEASRLAREIPEATTLAGWIGDVETLAERVAPPASLTTAELRVLHLLPTHLSFREMAAGLHVSANTVKTHAHAVYRKLDASSRSQAVRRAHEGGLLGATGGPNVELWTTGAAAPPSRACARRSRARGRT